MLQSVHMLCLSVSANVLNCKIYNTLKHRQSTKAYVTLGLVKIKSLHLFSFHVYLANFDFEKNPKFN